MVIHYFLLFFHHLLRLLLQILLDFTLLSLKVLLVLFHLINNVVNGLLDFLLLLLNNRFLVAKGVIHLLRSLLNIVVLSRGILNVLVRDDLLIGVRLLWLLEIWVHLALLNLVIGILLLRIEWLLLLLGIKRLLLGVKWLLLLLLLELLLLLLEIIELLLLRVHVIIDLRLLLLLELLTTVHIAIWSDPSIKSWINDLLIQIWSILSLERGIVKAALCGKFLLFLAICRLVRRLIIHIAHKSACWLHLVVQWQWLHIDILNSNFANGELSDADQLVLL